MQFPRDWLAKGVLQGAIEGPCVVHVEEQVTPEVLAIDAWCMKPMRRWPRGCYASVVERGPRLVVTPELPPTRETLLLRMMGADGVLQRALDDLNALPRDAWERAVAEPLVALIRRDLARMGITLQLTEKDPVHDFKVIKQAWEMRKSELRAEGKAEGKAEGLAEGLRPLMRQVERRLDRSLTESERESLAARFDIVGPDRLGDVVLDLDAAALAAWITDPDAR